MVRRIRIDDDPAVASRSLSIGDVAARTGVPQATLRTWERRYGLPRPRRLPGGHRRYNQRDVALVGEVQRHRTTGLRLAAAVSAALAGQADAEPSIFAALRERHPDLLPVTLRKPTLLALSRAVEDECCARAVAPVLFASFQRTRFYRRSQARWEELARTARQAVVFADFPEPAPAGASPLRVAIPASSPMRREWVLVCDAPDYPACLAGWEHPGGQGGADQLFEVVWSVDPAIVREAARHCARLAEAFAPESLGPETLIGTPAPASPDLHRATSLLTRVMAYVDGARR